MPRQKREAVPKEEPPTIFEVGADGLLRVADFVDATTREDFYEDDLFGALSSPTALLEALEACPPLEPVLHTLYCEARDRLLQEIAQAQQSDPLDEEELEELTDRLDAMPDEPGDGLEQWLGDLWGTDFEEWVAPRVQAWMDNPPDWDDEAFHLLDRGTGQAVAYGFFRDMDTDAVDLLGVKVIEGDRPGSTYYAAELHSDIEAANAAAVANRIAVRFVRAGE